ncbi:MAG: FAD-binding protein, partial [Bacteroidales bacterium]|nr:FAD-binding protein [Bacteroidales bacterium]
MLHSDFSLLQYNTFGIDEQAKFFFSFSDKQELAAFLKNEFRKDLPYFVLGGGSNVLLTKPFAGTVIHPENKGISVVEEQGNDVLVSVAAGEVWDDFVQWAVSNNLHGVENLSFIPGCVGASPVQNIGAYGSEAKDAIYRVVCMAIGDQEERIFSNEECRFGYRDSVFKHEEAGKYIVT